MMQTNVKSPDLRANMGFWAGTKTLANPDQCVVGDATWSRPASLLEPELQVQNGKPLKINVHCHKTHHE